MPSKFTEAWEAMEEQNPRPTRVREIKHWEWDAFKDAVHLAGMVFIIAQELFGGEAPIVIGVTQ